MAGKMRAKAINVNTVWLAPKPNPAAIARKRKLSSSGSFIAARNRTMDKAPTSPRERANDDFTMVMTTIVVVASKKKLLENRPRFDIEFPYLT